jgi:hypothetical protein
VPDKDHGVLDEDHGVLAVFGLRHRPQ